MAESMHQSRQFTYRAMARQTTQQRDERWRQLDSEYEREIQSKRSERRKERSKRKGRGKTNERKHSRSRHRVKKRIKKKTEKKTFVTYKEINMLGVSSASERRKAVRKQRNKRRGAI